MFEFQGHKFNYCDHPHNNTSVNERRVEVPLIGYFLNKYSGRGTVEIGAVSPYYFEGSHLIYDLTDEHPKSVKKDAIEVSVYDQALLSVSTIEHIFRADGFNSQDDRSVAPNLLDRWLNICGPYLITWPMGYHPELDSHAIKKHNCKFIARRPYPSYEWKQVSLDELTYEDKTYGTFSCANAIIVLESVF